jgi:predicted hydrolase (HD superfamily)
MNVIDKILNEWSFRCHDGIVDMNDLKKVSILKEILIEEGIDDDILDATLNLPKDDPSSEEKKLKALAVLTGGDDEKDKEIAGFKQDIINTSKKKKEQEEKVKEIEDILKEKDIPEDILDLIVLRSEKRDLLTPLKDLINSTTLKDLDAKGQLKVNQDLKWINNLTATQSSLSLGKGEILLTIMLKDAILARANDYDIDINNEQVEVKQSGRNKEGKPTGAIISKAGRSSNYENVWTNDFKNKYFGPEYEGKLSSWNAIYNKYHQLEPSLQSKFINDINNLVFKKYNSKLENSDFEGNLEKLCKKVAYNLVGMYLDNKILIILSSDLEYLVLDKGEYLKQIITNDELRANSSFIPRISYKELIPIEDDEDLSDEEENPKPKKINQKIQKLISDLNLKFEKKFNKIVTTNISPEGVKKLRKEEFLTNEEFKDSGKQYYVVNKEYIDLIDLKENNLDVDIVKELTDYLVKSFKE